MEYRILEDELSLSEEEAKYLYDSVIKHKPDVLLEIGTHRGVSTTYLAAAIKENGKGHLWTTDPIDYGQAQTFDHRLKEFVTFEYKMGKDIDIGEKIDFAFVDGFHTKDDVLPEIKNLLPKLNNGAVVVFHDAEDEPENNRNGVRAALKACGILDKCTYIKSKNSTLTYTHETHNLRRRQTN